MATEIYYFSGSGNSLHVARELQRRLPDASLRPIVRCLEEETVKPPVDTVGLVFPIHGLTLPIPVRRFVRRLDLASVSYLFAIATRAATPHRAFEAIDRILDRTGRRLDAFFTLTMPSNDPKFRDWRPPTPEEAAQLESVVQSRLDTVQEILVRRKTCREPDTDCPVPVHPLLLRLVPLAVRYAEIEGARDYFYADDRCTGCGTCAKVCPARKVRMACGRPEWKKGVTCYLCYACLNYCPKGASQIKSKVWMRSYTAENERYPHPHATADEIAAQR